MATWFAQNSSVNIDSVNQWNSAANGSGSWLTWASLGASDVLVLNGKTGIVINVDFVCGSLTAVATGGTAGGGCTVASTRSITANVICSSAGTPVITLNSGTLTVVGNVTGGGTNVSHGIQMFGTSVLLVTGNVTGGTMNPLGGTSHGIRSSSSGAITIVGNVIGTTGSPAIYTDSSGSVTVTGNVTAGSAVGINTYGIHSVAVNAIIVTGDVTGDAVDGIYVTAGSTVTVNGNVYSGSVGAGINTNSLLAKFIVNGNLIASSAGVNPVVRVCLLISPSAQITHTYRVNNAGSAGVARSLYTGGVNLGQPVAANVRSGTTYGAASEYTGTLAVPSPTLVAIGVPTDNTVGSYAPTGGLDAAGVRSAIGLATANIDTQLAAIKSSADAALRPTTAGRTLDVSAAHAALSELDSAVGEQLQAIEDGVDASNNYHITTLARLGAWAGTGINTILGAFRALAAKLPGITPTDISSGTTYNNAAHSLEAAATIANTAIAPAPLERNPTDTGVITFAWPVSGATITGTVSIDNAEYVAVAGTIAFLREDSGRYYYTLSYDAADRPTAAGSARYTLTDGEYTRYVILRVVESGDTGEATAMAVLKLDWQTITGEVPSRSVLNALRHIRNKWALDGHTKTVYAEDDTTPAFTSTVTTDGAGNITADTPN